MYAVKKGLDKDKLSRIVGNQFHPWDHRSEELMKNFIKKI
jgi:hypothetical protein